LKRQPNTRTLVEHSDTSDKLDSVIEKRERKREREREREKD